mmetsp:Transcript_11541/g.36527  ORF Transcript_11541/g.36527 Transcript_11541/m.36527 type:complete len:301 (+) Transcript_11541:1438-2340(+)
MAPSRSASTAATARTTAGAPAATSRSPDSRTAGCPRSAGASRTPPRSSPPAKTCSSAERRAGLSARALDGPGRARRSVNCARLCWVGSVAGDHAHGAALGWGRSSRLGVRRRRGPSARAQPGVRPLKGSSTDCTGVIRTACPLIPARRHARCRAMHAIASWEGAGAGQREHHHHARAGGARRFADAARKRCGWRWRARAPPAARGNSRETGSGRVRRNRRYVQRGGARPRPHGSRRARRAIHALAGGTDRSYASPPCLLTSMPASSTSAGTRRMPARRSEPKMTVEQTPTQMVMMRKVTI